MGETDGLIRFPHSEPPAHGEVTEVADGILWARLQLPMVLNHVNIYILDDGDGWTVVDTGIDTSKARAIWETLLDGPLAGKPVRRVILTHHHPDHLGLVGWFQARGAELITTRTAWLFGRMLTLDVQEKATEEALTFYTRAGMPPEMVEKRRTERPFNFADGVHPIPVGYTRIKQDDRIRIGGRDWTVEIGNGHAPEHATFWTDDLILSGDQIIPGISSNIGVYPTEPAADPLGDWIESCTRLSGLAHDGHLALPGHKLPFTGVPARLRQLIENHENALPRLIAFLAEPRVAPECFPLLFKRKIDGSTYGLALAEAIAHLNHLHAIGAVSRQVGEDGAWRWQSV
ncbi:MBL fold metallo-hydrolase [Pontivivens insulae]|uniref:Hydroxyacylglutathione hydrolase n=1 Tax=Pontivivens insulae TaxID=1639689 RepID=A0A2R8A7K7_9RHOB|nr:MBL fold metallo-hydrolase [Pontivivens insulae]RED18315.1 glyoxylase-like metal-dependent hydrolase (beta-lactamase superfamily II) [Pontivivens insulae]SPF28213.1 Hydroxyacylglutathione hydrolase [Pontivivens insulae]